MFRFPNSRYNGIMQVNHLHGWNITRKEAVGLQQDLASKVITDNYLEKPVLIAALDVSINRQDEAVAAAVILKYPELELVEKSIGRGKIEFPYIPGLLSFREIPLTLKAFSGLSNIPDLVMVDGQGIAHPRRIGLASHLGLFLDLPVIGCAKSHLCGDFVMPGRLCGDYSLLKDEAGEVIGAALRSKTGCKPLFVSIGHKIDLMTSLAWM